MKPQRHAAAWLLPNGKEDSGGLGAEDSLWLQVEGGS